MTQRQRDLLTVFSTALLTFILTPIVGPVVIILMVIFGLAGLGLYKVVANPHQVDSNEDGRHQDEDN